MPASPAWEPPGSGCAALNAPQCLDKIDLERCRRGEIRLPLSERPQFRHFARILPSATWRAQHG